MCNKEGDGAGKRITPPATDQAGEGYQSHEVQKPPSLSPTLSAADQADEGDSSIKVHDSALPFFSVSPATTYRVAGTLNSTPASFIVDTGAAVTLISRELWEKAKSPRAELEPWTGVELVGANGTPMTVCRSAAVALNLPEVSFPIQVVVVEHLTAEAILGMDFLTTNHCTIHVGKELEFPALGVSVPLTCCSTVTQRVTAKPGVFLVKMVKIPPASEMEVMAAADIIDPHQDWVLEGEQRVKLPIMMARAVVRPVEGRMPVRILNLGTETVTIYSGTRIAHLERIEEASILHLSPTTTAAESEQPEENVSGGGDKLWEMVEENKSLDPTQKGYLYQLLRLYKDIFAQNKTDFGRTNKIKHSINTGDATPIRQPVRRVPPARREELKKLLDSMLEKDVIQPSTSPWASPIVLVQKKDGTLRLCVDYRKVNDVTRKDAYPLPRVDDTLDTLSGSKWFTTLDLISGYWQVEVCDGDIDKTAFCTTEGLFEFKVMPFGLSNSPVTFQRLMDAVLAGLQWSNCLVYLDDIIIPGRTFKEHLKNLSMVFDRLREAGLKLHPKKCAFCQQQVTFLGHVISDKGIATDENKTKKVAAWPEPTSKKEVRQFLGLASYYRHFVKDFATMAKPLHQLTENMKEFKWTTECQDAFNSLRRCLTTTPVLAFPDFHKPFTLDTDASDSGIGAVLSQTDDHGGEHVVAYASRVLSKTERRYCVTRKELLAVVTYIRHFRPYLLGRHFTLRTDHGSLNWLRNFKEPEGQLARWLEQLEEYDFSIVHRPGRKHGNADALSRQPCQQCGREEFTAAPVTPVGTIQLLNQETSDIYRAQLADPIISPVLQAKQKNERRHPKETNHYPPATRRLFQLWDQLQISNGLLWRIFETEDGSSSTLQLVVPSSLKEDVLNEVHAGVSGAHLGQEKTMARLKERFYWPGQWNDVSNWCRTCPNCATRKTPSPRGKAPLGTIVAGYPMQIIAVDILGPLPQSEAGNSYILVAGDYFSRWMEAYPIPNQEASTVSKVLIDQWFCRFSTPEQLHSDQGRQFESELLAEICKVLGIRKSRTTPYHPQSDGLVERFNRTLLDMLATTVKECPLQWESHLKKVCFAYNTSIQATTGFTPFSLVFGRQARIPIDVMFPTNKPEATTHSEFATALRKTLESAYELVRKKTGMGHARQKEYYDQKIHGKPFQIGDQVWLHSPAIRRGQSKKLRHPWTGPWQVVKRLSDAVYRIRSLKDRRKRTVVHFDRLKSCSPEMRLNTNRQNPPVTTPAPQPMPQPQELEPRIVSDDEDDQSLLSQPPLPNTSSGPPSPTLPRYPRRERTVPDRYGAYVSH